MDLADLVRYDKGLISHDQGWSDYDLENLARVLRESNAFESLSLLNNRIHFVNEKFADALAQNCTLRVLHVGRNQIGVRGSKMLAAALKINTTLQELGLDCNQIGDEGATLISGALNQNKSLQQINFEHNNIGSDGAKMLACALMVNEGLKKIFLGFNIIGDDGAECMAASLLVNESLQRIEFSGCGIGDRGGEKLVEALACNNAIEHLAMWPNPMKKQTIKKIHAIIKSPSRKVRVDGSFSVRGIVSTVIQSKDEKIAELKLKLKNSKPSAETVDLTSEETEPLAKRPRTENLANSNLAYLHDQNQKLVKVKKEKVAAEIALGSAQKEKNAALTDLNEAREDLEESNDLVQQQALATDIWQRRFDELAACVAGQVDGAVVAAIRSRSLASGS